MSSQSEKHRIAINRLFTPQGVISPAVVELCDGKIVAYSRLDRELPFTEWRGGEMTIDSDWQQKNTD